MNLGLTKQILIFKIRRPTSDENWRGKPKNNNEERKTQSSKSSNVRFSKETAASRPELQSSPSTLIKWHIISQAIKNVTSPTKKGTSVETRITVTFKKIFGTHSLISVKTIIEAKFLISISSLYVELIGLRGEIEKGKNSKREVRGKNDNIKSEIFLIESSCNPTAGGNIRKNTLNKRKVKDKIKLKFKLNGLKRKSRKIKTTRKRQTVTGSHTNLEKGMAGLRPLKTITFVDYRSTNHGQSTELLIKGEVKDKKVKFKHALTSKILDTSKVKLRTNLSQVISKYGQKKIANRMFRLHSTHHNPIMKQDNG